jgi:hypothetical protein
MKKIKILLLGLMTFCSLQNFTYAGLVDEIQVYDGEINKPGEFGLELHLNTSPSGKSSQDFDRERVTDRGIRITPELSYGLNEALELGFYIPTIYTPEYGYELAGYKPRIKWIPIQAQENQPWSAGVNVEYAKLKTGMSESAKSSEIRFILGYEGERWRLAMNPILEKNFSPRTDSTPELEMNFRAILKQDGFIKGVGLEYYQSLGPYNNFSPANEQNKQLFLVSEIEFKKGPLKDWDIHLAAGSGWDGADPFTVKMILAPKL